MDGAVRLVVSEFGSELLARPGSNLLYNVNISHMTEYLAELRMVKETKQQVVQQQGALWRTSSGRVGSAWSL